MACQVPAALLAMAWVSQLHSKVAAWAVFLWLVAAVHPGLPARRGGSPTGLGMGKQTPVLSGLVGG